MGNSKWGVGDNQFGVKLGDKRKIAAKIKSREEVEASAFKALVREAVELNRSSNTKPSKKSGS